MKFRKTILATILVATASLGLPAAAEAGDGRGWHRGYDDDDDRDRRHWRKHKRHHHHHHYYSEPRRHYSYDRPRRSRCGSGTTGLILGGAAGALLGREVDRYGDRTPGTIIGAGAGALIGRELDRGC